MRSAFNESTAGNSIIEMLLFTPLALLFLFAATDAGLALKDRSGVIEAVRSSLTSHPLRLSALEEGAAEGSFSREAQSSFLAQIAADIEANIRRSRAGTDRASIRAPYLRVSLVLAEFDERAGTLRRFSLDKPDVELHTEAKINCPDFDLADYAANQLEREKHLTPSSLAIPLGKSFAAGADRYLTTGYLLAVQVCGKARGLAGDVSGPILGGFFAFHEEQLLPLKIQAGVF